MTDLIRADDEPSVKAKEIEDALKADKARKDAEAEETTKKLCDAVEGLTTALGGIMDRMDALEAGKKADEDDLDLDAETGKPRKMLVDADEPDENEMASAQSKADHVAGMHGKSAPKPLHGEKLLAYRRRLLRPFMEFSDAFKSVDLQVASVDKATFEGIEARVYADAIEAAKNPRVAAGRLMQRSRTVGGHTYTEWFGDPAAWMSDYSPTGQAVTGFNLTRK